MKRSEINRLIRSAEAFIAERNFFLPPFAFWTPADWRRQGPEADEIRRNHLGWDLTDYGRGDFNRFGLVLFTIRNGNLHDSEDSRRYGEKILLVAEGQGTPWHFHWQKTEDIIVRGGGVLVLELARATPDEAALALDPVTVSTDGVRRTVEARGPIELAPGESVTIPHHLYHTFYGRAGRGRILVGEVSNVNDDANDNRFLETVKRFPDLEEDEPPYRLLVNEYPPA